MTRETEREVRRGFRLFRKSRDSPDPRERERGSESEWEVQASRLCSPHFSRLYMRCRVGCISLKLVSRASACVFRFVSGGIEWDYSALPKRDHFEFHETLNFIYELPHVLILKMSNRLLFGKARKRLLIPYISTSQVREILSPLLYNIGSNIFLFALFCVVFNLI